MPTYPPPLLDYSSPYWQINTKIVTPIGTMEGAFIPQNQPDGSATLLYSTSDGIMRPTADCAQMGLDGGNGTGVPRSGFGSPYQPAGGDAGKVRAPCYVIGINLGLRKGGHLGCNVSISYFAENAKPMAGFWQQDISYYRQWNYIGTPPPPYFWTTSLPNPLPSAPDGWTYAVGPPFFFSGDGKFYNAAVPLPTGYRPVTPIRYGGGSPVFASQGSAGHGQLFQQNLPTSSNAVPDPRAGSSIYQQILAGLDNNDQTLSYYYSDSMAFIGDIFPLPPYNFVADSLGEIFWLSTPLHSCWGAAAIPANVVLAPFTHISTPFVPYPILAPDFGYYSIDANGIGNGIVMDAYGNRYSPPVPFLIDTGIPLGLGCTIYYLTACKRPKPPSSPSPPPPPPPCNIKVIQSIYANSGHPVTTATCTFTNTVTAGNTILAVVRGENNQPITVSDNQGNTYIPDVQQDNQSDYILSAWRTTAHASGFLTLTVTTPPTLPAGGPIGMTIDLMEVAGLADAGLVLTGYRTGLSGNVFITGDGAVGDNCDLLIASYVAETNTQSYPDSPWATLESSRLDPTGDTVWQETHGLVIGPSAYWTLQAAVPWTAIMVAYKTS